MSSITADGDDKLMFRIAPAALGLGNLGFLLRDRDRVRGGHEVREEVGREDSTNRPPGWLVT